MSDEGALTFWPWRTLLDHPRAAELGLASSVLDIEANPDEPPASVRFRSIEQATHAVLRAAERSSVVLILEDLQWADQPSLQLLRHLCAGLSDARVLVVGTYRDPDGSVPLPQVLAGLAGLPPVSVLRLRPLGVADVAAYLDALGGAVHPSWPEFVHQHSGGNALFIRELARVLAEEDRLSEPARSVAIPAELRKLISHRLASLSDECLLLLGVASAIGEEIDVALLSDVVGDTAPTLAEALAAGVLTEDAESPALLRFSHDVIRQAVYEGLPRAERVETHRRIANALYGRRACRVGVLAMHRMRSAVDVAGCRLAMAAAQSAADDASIRRATAEAVHWCEQVLGVLDRAQCDDQQRCAALIAAAEAAFSDGQVTDALNRCTAAADLAERLGRADLAAAAALVVRDVGGEPNRGVVMLCERARALLGTPGGALHARVLAQQAKAVEVAGNMAEAGALSARALAMAEDSGDHIAVIDAVHARYLAVGGSAIDEGLALGTRMTELAAKHSRPEAALWGRLWRIDAAFTLGSIGALDTELSELQGQVEGLGWALARWHLLRARASRALLVGRFAEAEELTVAAHELSLRTQDRSADALCYSFIGELMQLTGRFVQHGADYRRAVESAIHLPIAAASHARYLCYTGEADAARELYEHLRSRLAELPRDMRWVPTVIGCADLAVVFADRDTAELCYDLLLPFRDLYANVIPGCLGAITRVLGVLAGSVQNYADSEGHLRAALVMESRIGAVPFLARAQLAYATMLRARGGPGDRAQAIDLAHKSLHTARRIGMAPTAAQAQALADALHGAADDTSTLTKREREIAALVAAGLANRAIADRFVLSERTIETHVRNILTKLDLTNRTQIAAWAVRAGVAPEREVRA
ncbi:MAG: helix-turn-helix transcriptional regulator [Haloechinothrix sp.]